MFVDRVEASFKAGDGGNGLVSFHHEKYREKGGPDGGDGGNGGSIILVASNSQNTLASFRYKKLLQAPDGGAGGGNKRHGRNGVDLEVRVPVGTVVSTAAGEVLADFTADGQKQVLAKGGQGGFGNAHFVSSVRQVPQVAEKGESGQIFEAILELKMIADVGLVGLPNAGKSTLLSVISNAKPEIANYPFTTLRPNLGVVDIDGQTSLLFADIPGLIEGASRGKGLGDEFLRHVERTKVLVHLIDIYNEDLAAAYKTIIKELKDYQIDLSKRPQIVALSKIEGVDQEQLDEKLAELKKLVPKNSQVMAISSASGLGVKELLRSVAKMAAATPERVAKKAEQPQLPVIGFEPKDDSWLIQKQDSAFVVTGVKIERFARRTNFEDYHGEQRLRDIMAKMGIMRELQRQGIETDQKIIIGQPPVGEISY